MNANEKMKAKKILIIAWKKPLLEPRMKKIAQSLNHFHIVYLLANEPEYGKNVSNQNAHSYKTRKLYTKLWEAFVFVRSNKPDLIVIQHPILIFFSLFYSCVYDVQENYRLNFLHNPVYQRPKKYLLYLAVTLWEGMFSPFVKEFWLAEKIYCPQLHFKPSLVVENKFLGKPPRISSPERPIFLVCGTISRLFGAQRAVVFFERIQTFLPESELEIVGHGVEADLLRWLKQKASNNLSIKLSVFPKPCEHELILEKMAACSFVLLPHEQNPCTFGKIPTKVYECLALKKPMIAQKGQVFSELIESCGAGILLDFEQADEKIITSMSKSFYQKPLVVDPFWQEDQLLLASNKLLNA